MLDVLPQKNFKSCLGCNVGNRVSFLRAWSSSDVGFCFSLWVKKQNLKSLVLVVLLEKEEENNFIFLKLMGHMRINQLCFQ